MTGERGRARGKNVGAVARDCTRRELADGEEGRGIMGDGHGRSTEGWSRIATIHAERAPERLCKCTLLQPNAQQALQRCSCNTP